MSILMISHRHRSSTNRKGCPLVQDLDGWQALEVLDDDVGVLASECPLSGCSLDLVSVFGIFHRIGYHCMSNLGTGMHDDAYDTASSRAIDNRRYRPAFCG
jgi:hypothetical protein